MKVIQRFCLLVLICMTLIGCNRLHHAHISPPPDLPSRWHGAPFTTQTASIQWRDFRDPDLQIWVARVLANNRDIKQATLNLAQSENTLSRNESNRLPVLSGGLSDGTNRMPGSSAWSRSSNSQVGLSLTLDLTGAQESKIQAAAFSRESMYHSREAIRQNLIVKAAELYWGIALVNEQIRVKRHSVQAAVDLLAITQARHDSGELTGLNVTLARQNLLDQQLQLARLKHEKSRQQRAQAVLLGVMPDTTLSDPSHLPIKSLPTISAGIPATVLARRPDLQAAKARLQEANAQIDVANAGFYPDINLTAAAGSSSVELLRYIAQPLISVSSAFTMPFLNWEQHLADLHDAQNVYQKIRLDWEQAIYQAMVDVENALSQRTFLINQESNLQQALNAAREAERISQANYDNGVLMITDITDAQMRRQHAELALLVNRYEQLNNLAILWRELGGDAEPLSPTVRNFPSK